MAPSSLPGTDAERQAGFLSFAAVLGGGAIAYQAGKSIREGDLFRTDALRAPKEVGALTLFGGLVFLGYALKVAADEYGATPLLLGGAGIFGLAVIGRALKR